MKFQITWQEYLIMWTKNQGNTTVPSNITQSDQEIVIVLETSEKSLSISEQADKMLALPSVKYPTAYTGDNVVVKIPDVYHAKASDRKFMVVIFSQESEGMYMLGIKHQILNQLYVRNRFNMKLPSENVQ